MIIVSGTILVETEAEVARVASTLKRRAEKCRADEGNLDYVFTVNIENPLEIRLYEAWESEDMLSAHLLVPDEEFNQLLAGAKISRAQVLMHETGGTRELFSR